jgi:hypothetical protein
MSDWTSDELDRLAEADVLQLASRRDDGSLRPYVTMWIVVDDRDAYVRSAGGPHRPWYRRALADRTGRIRAGGLERDVRFDTEPAPQDAIDVAYHRKYDRYGPLIVGSVVGAAAHEVTIRLIPQEATTFFDEATRSFHIEGTRGTGREQHA